MRSISASLSRRFVSWAGTLLTDHSTFAEAMSSMPTIFAAGYRYPAFPQRKLRTLMHANQRMLGRVKTALEQVDRGPRTSIETKMTTKLYAVLKSTAPHSYESFRVTPSATFVR
jgi:hypothetical protein